MARDCTQTDRVTSKPTWSYSLCPGGGNNVHCLWCDEGINFVTTGIWLSVISLSLTVMSSFEPISPYLEFYFWFRFRLHHRNRHAILHQAAEFHPNRTIDCGNMTSYRFFKMAAAVAQYCFRFRIYWCPGRQKVKIYQRTNFRRHQWSTYINLWLRYNDFWFGKTNVHHIVIPLSVPILTISP